MLFKETVDPRTLEIIKELMADDVLKDFNLAGGTALSLQVGHRKSIDIDLFNNKNFDIDIVQQHLSKNFNAEVHTAGNNSLKGFVEGVRIDLTSHQYPLVRPIQIVEGIRMFSLEDIAAMKFNAITKDPRRIKDFIDVYAMLEHKNLNNLIKSFVDKYPDVNTYMAKQSLVYHEIINFDIADKKLLKIFVWEKVKTRLEQAIKEPNKIFSTWQKKSLKRNKGRRI